MTDFKSTSFIITTNFNPIDPFFDNLQLKSYKKDLTSSKFLLNLPEHTYYDF